MNPFGVALATAVAVTGAIGCAKPLPPTPPDPTLAHIGVWYGSGMAFPAGQLCVVFCPNQKFFAADTTCDDTAHADFQRAWTWSRTEEGILLANREDGKSMPMRLRPQEPAEALIDLIGYPALPMARIDLLSSVCLY
jgi:hypothetical protein